MTTGLGVSSQTRLTLVFPIFQFEKVKRFEPLVGNGHLIMTIHLQRSLDHDWSQDRVH